MGSLQGTVFNNATGQPLEGAYVTLSRESRLIHRAVTNPAGQFRFGALAPGGYTIECTLENYRISHGFNPRITVSGAETVRIPMERPIHYIRVTYYDSTYDPVIMTETYSTYAGSDNYPLRACLYRLPGRASVRLYFRQSAP